LAYKLAGKGRQERRKTMKRPFALFLVVCGLLAPLAGAQSLEERVKALEAQVRALQEELQKAPSPQRLQELQREIQVLAEELAKLQHGETMAPVSAPRTLGLAPAASKVYAAGPGVSWGGYGEMLYQNFASRRQDGRPSGKVDTADAYRVVLYTGYKFAGPFLFNSELELEHAHTGKGGEMELEFAYVDYLPSPALSLRAGMVLVPLGLVNEVHEPTTFFPARRSETESRIIPTTWRELGVGIYGDVGPFSYRTFLLTALDASKFSARGLRDGRQAGAKAKAETWAWAGRLDWTATPGLLFGFGAYWGESGQDLKEAQGKALAVPTSIYEAHGEWKPGRFTLRGLWAQAHLGDVRQLNTRLGLSGAAGVGRKMQGGYVELAYDLLAADGRTLAPFLRWERLNTQKSVSSGFRANPANDEELFTLGLAYQPIPQLIFKADWQRVQNQARTGVNQWNLALGYVF
jgi:hypothetical protein